MPIKLPQVTLSIVWSAARPTIAFQWAGSFTGLGQGCVPSCIPAELDEACPLPLPAGGFPPELHAASVRASNRYSKLAVNRHRECKTEMVISISPKNHLDKSRQSYHTFYLLPDSSDKCTCRNTIQSVQSYAALSVPARMKGSPSKSSGPCKSKPEKKGLLAEPTLRASEVMLAVAVLSDGSTRAIVYA